MRYELIYVLPGNLGDAEIPAVKAKVDALLERLGIKPAKNDHAGKLKIAYPIKHQRYGHYMKVDFEAERASTARLASELRLIPEVIRQQLIKITHAKAAMPATLVSHEEAGVRAREFARAAAAHRAAPAPVPSPVAAPLPSAPKLTEEQIEEKIEKILSDETIQGM